MASCECNSTPPFPSSRPSSPLGRRDHRRAQKSGGSRHPRRGTGPCSKAQVSGPRITPTPLPRDEDPPPVPARDRCGHVIELYADFSQEGENLPAVPDARSHRTIGGPISDATPSVQAPHALARSAFARPGPRSAEVHPVRWLAAWPTSPSSFEQRHDPKEGRRVSLPLPVLHVCEDVGLSPKDSFTRFLDSLKRTRVHLCP